MASTKRSGEFSVNRLYHAKNIVSLLQEAGPSVLLTMN
jgi:hypothetical protein